MEPNERERLAVERAEQYAPMPKGGAYMAGICGAAVMAVADFAILRFYAWPLREHWLIAGFAAAAGFMVAFLGYKRLVRLSRRARHAERARIDAQEDRSG